MGSPRMYLDRPTAGGALFRPTMGGSDPRTDVLDKLDDLRTTLQAASGLAAELMADPLLMRLIQVFHAMPTHDRATVVGAIERDVQSRLLSRATERVTGQGSVPNPRARLYIRTHGPAVEEDDLERDDMMLATLRALRVVPILLLPEIHAVWRDATRAALEDVDAATRDGVERLVREVLDLLADIRAQVA